MIEVTDIAEKDGQVIIDLRLDFKTLNTLWQMAVDSDPCKFDKEPYNAICEQLNIARVSALGHFPIEL